MLEDRLSSAYSQQNLGYGMAHGAPQYPSMHGLPPQAPDGKTGAENFYYVNQPDTSQPPSSAYAPPPMHAGTYESQPTGVPNQAYPSQGQYAPSATESHNNWSQNPYPSLASPPPNGAVPSPHVAPEPVGSAQHYAPPLDPNATPVSAETPPWQPSPIARRDSQYQSNAPRGPSAPDTHSPEHLQSPLYSTVPPTGVPAPQQPTGYPPQSYYYQPHGQPSYPPMATGQPGPYPDANQSQPASQQPARPVEESLIEL